MDDIDRFLYEDLNEEGDITTKALFKSEIGKAKIIAKESMILAGLNEAKIVFEKTGAKLEKNSEDGGKIQKYDCIAVIKGPFRSILSAERLALNFLGRMSGIATQTQNIVSKCKQINPNIEILATRKTTPGFRKYEKKAVELGGGLSHRFGLFDAVMIKDNHFKAKGDFNSTIDITIKKILDKNIIIEVDTEDQALQAAKKEIDVIMLDNFSADKARKVANKIRSLNPDIKIEISGGITPSNIIEYASFADRISLGYLTHTIKNKDFSLEII